MGMLNSGACDVSHNSSTEEHGCLQGTWSASVQETEVSSGWAAKTTSGPQESSNHSLAKVLLCIDPIDTYLKMYVVSQSGRVGCRPAFQPVVPLWISLNGASECVGGLQESGQLPVDFSTQLRYCTLSALSCWFKYVY